MKAAKHDVAGSSGGSAAATATKPAESTKPRQARGSRTEPHGRPDRLDHPGRGRRRSWPPPTSTSPRRRSAAGRGPAGSRASSSVAGGSSDAARSGRSSRPRGASEPRISSPSCSRTWRADLAVDGPEGDPGPHPGAPAGRGRAGALDIYGRAAGGLLANGLAFSALFALIPTLLLVLGLVGWVAGDPAARDRISATLIAAFPAARGPDSGLGRGAVRGSRPDVDPRRRSA